MSIHPDQIERGGDYLNKGVKYTRTDLIPTMIQAAEQRALDSVTTLHTVIAAIREATVGSKPMLADLPAALVEWRREAVDAEREAFAALAVAQADRLSDAAKWGGGPKYVASVKGGEAELRNLAAAIRALKGGAE